MSMVIFNSKLLVYQRASITLRIIIQSSTNNGFEHSILFIYVHYIHVYLYHSIFISCSHEIFPQDPRFTSSLPTSRTFPACIATIEVTLQLGETPWRRAANVLAPSEDDQRLIVFRTKKTNSPLMSH